MVKRSKKNNSNNERENDLWTEKYRPKNLKEYYYNNETDLLLIEEWITNIIKNEPGTPPILLLSGKPGIGKTTLATLIFKKYNIEFVEVNASEFRTKKAINHLLSNITKYKIDFGGNKVRMGLLLDELDGVTSNEKGGLQEIIDYIKNYKKVELTKFVDPTKKTFSNISKISKINKTTDNNKIIDNKKVIKKGKSKKVELEKINFKFPIICTCNSVKDKKIGIIIKNNLFITIEKPTDEYCIKLIDRICDNEEFQISDNDKKEILKDSNNDFRQIILNLHKKYLNTRKNINFITNYNNDINNDNNNNKTQLTTDIADDYTMNLYEDIGENIITKLKYFIMNKTLKKEVLFNYLQSDTNQYLFILNTNLFNIVDIFFGEFTDKYKQCLEYNNNLIFSDYFSKGIYDNQEWELLSYQNYIGMYYNIIQINNHLKNDKRKNSKTTQFKYHSNYNYMRQEQSILRKNIANDYKHQITTDPINLYYNSKIMNNYNIKINNKTKKNSYLDKIITKIES